MSTAFIVKRHPNLSNNVVVEQVPSFGEIESREIPNDFDSCYTTRGGVHVSRSTVEVSMDTAIEDILPSLDSQRGGLLRSS